MYINFWYAACWSKDLTTEPKKIRMLDHDFVLFRDSNGKAHCLSDTCVHRGASLSEGLYKDDCVQCPYHGWRFDGDGNCVKIPSLGPGHEKKIPSRAKVDSYPVEERYDLVHVFLGDLPEAERPPIMNIPEWDDENWRGTFVDYGWESNYERNIENGLDPAHNEYVHPTHGYSGDKPDYKVETPNIDEYEWGSGFMLTFQAPPIKNPVMKRLRNFDGDLEAGSGHTGPNNMWTYIHLTPKAWMHQYVFETPIDDKNTKIFLICMRNVLLGNGWLTRKLGIQTFLDNTVTKRNCAIAEQDRIVIEKLEPVVTPPTRSKEILMPADRIVGMYRDKLDEWKNNGWQIDSDELRARRESGDVAFAIPSPARREKKGWVLDATPLVPGTSTEEDTDGLREAS